MNKHSHPTQPRDSVATPAPEPLLTPQDPIWRRVRDEALAAVESDAGASPLFNALILRHDNLVDALISVLALRLANQVFDEAALTQILNETFDSQPELLRYLAADLEAVYERDPACHRYVDPFLYFKGFQALQAHRFAHRLWEQGRQDLALFFQSRVSATCQMDIHPGTQIGGGIFFDHGTGIVIGETAVIDDNVSIMQNVTLGGTGKAETDRHPKVRCGVLVGAGAKVLGNIELGNGARIAASSVVLHPVPALATVAGIPAKIVGMAEALGPDCMPSLSMEHTMPNEPLVDEGSGI